MVSERRTTGEPDRSSAPRTADADDVARRPETYPEPDDSRKPQRVPDMRRPAWGYVFRRSVHEFTTDNCTDLAAALTYYSVLSIFPALVALVSLPALVGQGQQTTDALLRVVEDVAPAYVAEQVQGPVEQLSTTTAAGPALVIGLAAALWWHPATSVRSAGR